MRIYIACALTHVPRALFSEYVASLHNLAATLQERGGHSVKYAILNSDPQLASKPPNERARLCYLWDREMVEDAELVIGECSFPSTGLGIELQIAAAKGTPIILCFRDYEGNRSEPISYATPDRSVHELQIGEGYITLMALGLPTVLRVVRYDGARGSIAGILDAVALLQRS